MDARTWTVVDYALMFCAAGCAAVLVAIGLVIAWRMLTNAPLPGRQPRERR
jgi:hypothetical protein